MIGKNKYTGNLGSGSWVLVFGCRVLVAGYWLLGSGCLVLIVLFKITGNGFLLAYKG